MKYRTLKKKYKRKFGRVVSITDWDNHRRNRKLSIRWMEDGLYFGRELVYTENGYMYIFDDDGLTARPMGMFRRKNQEKLVQGKFTMYMTYPNNTIDKIIAE